jgi:hypothetical protein
MMSEKNAALRLRQLLQTLVLVLTFEGIVRKAAPSFLSIPLFMVKDVVVAVMAIYVLARPVVQPVEFLWNAYKALIVLMIPPFFITAWIDPLLGVFGLKEYVLYPVIGLAFFYGFRGERMDVLLGFVRRCAALLIPTGVLALVQLRLPSTHWLNMSVNRESMEEFMRGGEMRISSTFSFVAQYCTFLNAQIFMVLITMYGFHRQNLGWKIVSAILLPMLVLSCYATGSRASVAGNTAILLVAICLVMTKFRVRAAMQIMMVALALYLAALTVHYVSPNATAAYSDRENGQLIGISEEIRTRVYNSFFGLWKEQVLMTFFGHGIGIMSNGSDTFSSYADNWRAFLWTETDFSSTLFEGGFYLMFVWYGFRLFIIAVTTQRFLRDVRGMWMVPGAFVQGFVIVVGTIGTIGVQPVVAIWWWVGVGVSTILWWKCVGPRDEEIEAPPPLRPLRRLFRGRSRYAEVLHRKK